MIKKAIKNIVFELQYLLEKPVWSEKVFCIGYNKTGTTTIGKSFEILGYRNSSFNKKVWRKYYKEGKIQKVLNYTARFDSFDDLPWLKEDMIPVLDRAFPGSKFIFLHRDEESWKESFKNWTYFKTGRYPDLETGLEAFRAHRKFVLNYFEHRNQKDFLIIDVQDPSGFKKMASFLGKEAPQPHFPHFNKTSETKKT